ncbi:hypothetical protein A3G56_03155 [Candidatus Falkowbacteria bacterium RIFCSPLOWO2_12_FULL_45_10]|uniref:Large ribosomal subunit protein bL25 n=1 Tax=Candidatus Falkowbacteria bacterium RIFCSPLOWO2_12_FULL_45_10 TaxID=1797990 RepID=A0A1F5RWD4_9BACT|nr:MAG: hypothetical protein A3G56_03155 [Candidatus Falkowbacteria bacterium RIFCSPLOWO2_12_FULL_45_10]
MTQLKAATRAKETSVNKLRADGFIPAIIYSKGRPAASLTINYIQFEKLYAQAGESSLVDLILDEGQNKKVLIHDVQREPVKDKIIHVDFYEADLKQKLTAAVELEFSGEAPIIKSENGIIIKHLSEVEIECLPGDLLNKIAVDLSSLDSFDGAIYVKDLRVPEAVTILNDPAEMVVNVAKPKEEEEAPVEAAVPAEGETQAAAGAEGKEQPAEEAKPAEGKKEDKNH